MEHDFILKIGTFFIGLIGSIKVFYELKIGSRNRLRDDYKFTKDFLDSLRREPQMHPLLREMGYQAIAGDSRLSASEIEYLISLESPAQSLRDYVLGRKYLEPIQGQRLNFGIKYRNAWSRRCRKILYLFMYAICVFLAFFPLIFSKIFSSQSELLISFFLTIMVFGLLGWWFLEAATRVLRAERSVNRQSKHTQYIYVG